MEKEYNEENQVKNIFKISKTLITKWSSIWLQMEKKSSRTLSNLGGVSSEGFLQSFKEKKLACLKL